MQKEKKFSSIPVPTTSALLFEDENLAIDASLQKELAEYYEEFGSKFQTGKIVTGRVVNKDSNGVLISIDYKSDGLIPNYEFSDYELKKIVINEPIDVILDRLEDKNGMVVLSYQKAKSLKAWDKIAELAEKDEPVTGVVTHKVKGGLSVDVGIPAFLPGSQVDVQRVTDFDQFVNQEVTCKILKINKKRGNIIVSRRKYIEEQRTEDKKKALETIQDGQILQGVVKNITSYGVFIDIGGIDGLLHITDMSWGRIAHPSELVKIGQTIPVKVIAFDKAHEKISLGMKQLSSNPWENVDTKYPVNSKVSGRISSITDYGLFVEVEKGVEGLVHISEISWTERISHLAKHFSVGQTIEALVVALDKDNRRMSLSIKQMTEDPWKAVAEKFKIGDKISGKITNITDFGLFVQLLDGVDGLVHISDLSWTDHIAHPSDKFKKGDVVEAVVLAIDIENRKVSLGIKQLENDPWANVATEYALGSVVEGTVSKITSFGAFVKLQTGIEGLVHISELSNSDVSKVEDMLKVGQVEKFKVIKVSSEDRKLGLSLRALREPKPETAEKPAEQQHQERSQQAAPEREHRAPRQQQPRQEQHRERSHAKPKEQQHAHASQQSQPKGTLQQALEEHAAKLKQMQNDEK
ncbi:MAG: 30S ribosomal protein S1 [candidate division TM6 bacterium GW2011_GWF2_38_10]|nr:MAG: 30S ribosomal protein S1 [candidate division TM6 bacterium GW2011_GWF2_38_10]